MPSLFNRNVVITIVTIVDVSLLLLIIKMLIPPARASTHTTTPARLDAGAQRAQPRLLLLRVIMRPGGEDGGGMREGRESPRRGAAGAR